ncbi:hypothetical protein H5410_015368, partial [Solanum commersonii]
MKWRWKSRSIHKSFPRKKVSKMMVAIIMMLKWMCGHIRRDKTRNEIIRDNVREASVTDNKREVRSTWFRH